MAEVRQAGDELEPMKTSDVAKVMARDLEFRSRVQARANKGLFIGVFILLVIIMLTLAILCIVYGAGCLHLDCHPAPLAPAYLVTFGAVVLASLPNNFAFLVNPEKRKHVIFGVYRLVTWAAELATLIFGSVILYSPPLEELKKNYYTCPCLMVGFILVTASWLAICFALAMSCTVTCCYACAATREMKKPPQSEDGALQK